MKFITLSLALLSSVAYAAHLDVKFEYHNHQPQDDYQRDISSKCQLTLAPEESTIVNCEDNISISFAITHENTEQVTIQAQIFDKQELISEPTIVANWDKPATIKLGKKDNAGNAQTTLSLEIVASQDK